MPRVREKQSSDDNAAPGLIPLERIEHCILAVRGQRVMLDVDLAAFYGVPVRALNQTVKRNARRFPEDFAFQLTQTESESLRSQIVTLNDPGAETPSTVNPPRGRGQHRKHLPHVFTEHGALMAAGVLNSERAIQMSVLIIRAFARLRQILLAHGDLARRLEQLEREFVRKNKNHAAHIHRIYEILEELMNPPAPPRKGRIGFAG